jgi:hypothetical protein
MGIGWFVGSILILSLVTYIMAVYIGAFLDFIKFPRTPKEQPDESPKRNLWKWLHLDQLVYWLRKEFASSAHNSEKVSGEESGKESEKAEPMENSTKTDARDHNQEDTTKAMEEGLHQQFLFCK